MTSGGLLRVSRRCALFVIVPATLACGVLPGRAAPPDSRFFVKDTPLHVNTDGAPSSYHPEDPRGKTKAMNTVLNAIVVRKNGAKLSGTAALTVFEQWRDGGWKVPSGCKITWRNVFDGTTKPHLNESGPYQGYFVSKTALTNGMKARPDGTFPPENFLDLSSIPALVIPVSGVPGIKVGDLVVGIRNDKTTGKTFHCYGLVGDAGPALREASVAFNMALLGRTKKPTTYHDTLSLDIGSKVRVVIIRGTASYKLERPYSAANVAARVEKWRAEKGFASDAAFLAALADLSSN